MGGVGCLQSKDLWVIPGARMKHGDAHLIPMTDPLRDVLETLRQLGTGNGFVFPSPRGASKGHMNPSSMNQHLVRMGYKGVLNAHGIRAIPMTAGQEVLGFPAEIIQRQLSHTTASGTRFGWHMTAQQCSMSADASCLLGVMLCLLRVYRFEGSIRTRWDDPCFNFSRFFVDQKHPLSPPANAGVSWVLLVWF